MDKLDELYTIGDNDISIPLDAAIDNGNWEELKDGILYINIGTMLRNSISSWNGDIPNTKSELVNTIYDRINKDLKLFKSYLRDLYNCKVVVYRVHYENIRLPAWVNCKVPTTDKQKLNHDIYLQCMGKVENLIDVTHTSKFIAEAHTGPSFILTHFVVDLLHVSRDTKLLESHTGTLKPRSKFNSKLNLPKDLYFSIPFNPLTLYIYGDGKMYGRSERKLVSEFYKIITDAKLTPLTEYERFRFILSAKAPLFFDMVRNIKY